MNIDMTGYIGSQMQAQLGGAWGAYARFRLDFLPPPVEERRMSLGMNLAPATYFSREIPFADVMKLSSPWVSQNAVYQGDGSDSWDTGYVTSQPFDKNDWPIGLQQSPSGVTQALCCLVLRDLAPGTLPLGDYFLEWDGDGDVDTGYRGVSHRITANSARVTVSPPQSPDHDAGGILVRITRSNPNNHVRNIRLWLPEQRGNLFNNTFISALRAARFSVLRFMDWQRTNDSIIRSISDLPSTADRTYDTPRGVPLSIIVALCNAVNARPYICIPHNANAYVIREIFTHLSASILPPIIEYSNEVWNAQFRQYHDIASWPGNEPVALKAARAMNRMVGPVARSFASHPVLSRTTYVVMGQHWNPWHLEVALSALSDEGNIINAAGCAAYFGPDEKPDGTPRNVDEMAALCLSHIPSVCIPRLAANKALADAAGLPFITYEAGQHITAEGHGNNPELAAMLGVQSHPEMRRAYSLLLSSLSALDVEACCLFNFISASSHWGSWGHMTHLHDIAAPKYLALSDYLAALKALGVEVPDA